MKELSITSISKVKTILQINDNSKDAIISELIPLIEADYQNIRNKPFDTDSENKVVYPMGSERVAIKMIQYILQNNSPNVSSEKLGDYSISYDNSNSSHGYPQSIIDSIKRYVKFV